MKTKHSISSNVAIYNLNQYSCYKSNYAPLIDLGVDIPTILKAERAAHEKYNMTLTEMVRYLIVEGVRRNG